MRATESPDRTTGTRNDQWRTSWGRARRSPGRSTGRNDERNAAVMLGRTGADGPSAGADERVGGRLVATSAAARGAVESAAARSSDWTSPSVGGSPTEAR